MHFGLNKEFPDSLVYCLFKEEKYNHEKSIHGLGGKVLDKTWDISVPLSIPKEEGTYYLRIAIKSGWLPPTINSRLIRIDVKKPL